MIKSFAQFNNTNIAKIEEKIQIINEEAISVSKEVLKKLEVISLDFFKTLTETINPENSIDILHYILNRNKVDTFDGMIWDAMIQSNATDVDQETVAKWYKAIEKLHLFEKETQTIINEYVYDKYLDNLDLSDEFKKEVLLKDYSITPRPGGLESFSKISSILGSMFDNNNIIKKPLEFINSIVEKDKDIFEEEFEKFNDFYNLTSGGGFGYERDNDTKIPNNFFMQFQFNSGIYFLFMALQRLGYIKIPIQEMVSEFVSKNYIPVVAHELTHYEQILIQMKIRGNVGNPRYAYSKHERGSDKFMVDYLSEPQEIGAFATQFVSTLNASFPDKTSNELMQMVRNNEIPTDISDAIEYYYVKVVNYMKRGEKEGNPLVKKFKKNVYVILDSQSKEKSK